MIIPSERGDGIKFMRHKQKLLKKGTARDHNIFSEIRNDTNIKNLIIGLNDKFGKDHQKMGWEDKGGKQ